MMDFAHNIRLLSIIALPILFAITLHEAAHAWVADRCGDPTARRLGRLTLNPIAHIDLFGTIIMPIFLFLFSGFLFGYAKPVPVNFMNLKRLKRDMVLVAASGPATNFLLALASGIIFRTLIALDPMLLSHLSRNSHFIPGGDIGASILVPVLLMLDASVHINLFFMLFNMIPIPPLDGGRVLVGLLPDKGSMAVSRIEPYGIFIILLLVMADPIGIMGNIFQPLVNILVGLILGRAI